MDKKRIVDVIQKHADFYDGDTLFLPAAIEEAANEINTMFIKGLENRIECLLEQINDANKIILQYMIQAEFYGLNKEGIFEMTSFSTPDQVITYLEKIGWITPLRDKRYTIPCVVARLMGGDK